MAAFSAAVSFATRQAMTGAALTGIIWIVQVLLKDLFLQSSWAQYLLLFMGSNYPNHPALRGNQAVLASLGLLLFIAAWMLLRRQERYI